MFPVDKFGRSKLVHHYVAGKSVVNIASGDESGPAETTNGVSDSSPNRLSSALLSDGGGVRFV